MYGTAADMTGRLTIAEAKACGARGIGYGRHSARVNHVDTRAVPATFVDGL
jgi:hypothetical protein